MGPPVRFGGTGEGANGLSGSFVQLLVGGREEAMGAFTEEDGGTPGQEQSGKAEQGVAAVLQPLRSRGPSASSRGSSEGEGPGPRERVW